MENVMKMMMPEGMTAISVGGVELKADEEGCVDVPTNFVDEMRCHGLRKHSEKTDDAADEDEEEGEEEATAPKAPKKKRKSLSRR